MPDRRANTMQGRRTSTRPLAHPSHPWLLLLLLAALSSCGLFRSDSPPLLEDVSTRSSTLTTTELAVTADGEGVVDVSLQLRDEASNPVAIQGVPVLFVATLGTIGNGAEGSVQTSDADSSTTAFTNADGIARTTWRSSETGNGRVYAIVDPDNATTSTSDEVVAFYREPPDTVEPGKSSVRAPRATQRINEDDTVTVTIEVQVRDANGDPLREAGVPVFFTSEDGTVLTPVVVTNERGIATVQFAMPGGVGTTAQITAHLGIDAAGPIIGTVDVTFEAALVATDDGPFSLLQAGVRNLKLTDDVLGNDAATDGVPFSLVPDSLEGTGVEANLSGSDLVMTAIASVGDDAYVAYTIEDDTGRTDTARITFEIVPDLSNSIFMVSESILAADGEASTIVTVRLLDALGKPLDVADLGVIFTTTAGTLDPVEAWTNSRGEAVTTLMAGDSYPRTAMLTARLDDGTLIGSTEVQLSAPLTANDDGPIAVVQGANRTIDVATLLANDTSADESDFDLVAISDTDGVTVTTPTDTQLRITPTATAGTPASFTYVIQDAHGLRAQADVTITITGDASTSTMSVSPTETVPGGPPAVVTVSVADAQGIPIQRAGLPVTFTTTNGSLSASDATPASTVTARTDANGVARGEFTFTSGDAVGVAASITAHVGMTTSDPVVSHVDVSFPVLTANYQGTLSVVAEGSGTTISTTTAGLLANDTWTGLGAWGFDAVTAVSATGVTVTTSTDVLTVTAVAGASSGTLTYRIRDETFGTTATGIVPITVTLPPTEALIFTSETEFNAFKASEYTPPGFAEIFATWPRFDQGTYYPDPANPGGAAASWTLVSTTDSNSQVVYTVMQTENTSPSGFLSDEGFEFYTHEATLYSSDSDDDGIGLVIAYLQADGSSPATYLVAARSNGGVDPDSGWGLLWIEGTSTVANVQAQPTSFNTTGGWASSGASRIAVKRQGNTITLSATDWFPELSPSVGSSVDDLASATPAYDAQSTMTLNLNTGILTYYTGGSITTKSIGEWSSQTLSNLQRFIGARQYGYWATSQGDAGFWNVAFEGGADRGVSYLLTNPSGTDVWTGSEVWDFDDSTDPPTWNQDVNSTIQGRLGHPRSVTSIVPTSYTDANVTFNLQESTVEKE